MGREYKYEKKCIFCSKMFHTDHEEFQCCFDCYRFYQEHGGVKNYGAFLELFELPDSIESKEKYIQFVDNVKKFLEIRGDWRVDEILTNPDKFLNKVKKGEKRKKN
jgi:hypothetical protein